MNPQDFFEFCPRCGGKCAGAPGANPFRCSACGFCYFFNPAVATAVFVQRSDGKVLLIRRAKDPGRGKLAPPGGFIDIGETAETASIREIQEEVGLQLTEVTFLCSNPNSYVYRDVTYPVLDLFFQAKAMDAGTTAAPEEVSELGWYLPAEVSPEALAFPSMQAAWRLFRDQNTCRG